MKKVLIILLTICTFNICVNAENTERETCSRFTFGLEWGYVASIHSLYHYNFFSQDGFRVDDNTNYFQYRNNADIYLNAGWNISPVWNLSLYVGYAGVGNLHEVMPISIRGTRYFGIDPMSDRWFAFVDLGSGIDLKIPVQEILVGKIGGGYQMSLSRDTKLNFLFSVRSTYTHPNINFDGTRVPMDRINRNNALISALSIGVGLTF
jgi:hypothetical protein